VFCQYKNTHIDVHCGKKRTLICSQRCLSLSAIINYEDIGIRLKHIRGNITQKDFGNQFSVSKSYVNNIEHGSKPSLEFLTNVATSFDVSLDWIILGKQLSIPEFIKCTGRIQGTTLEENSLRTELLQMFDALTPDAQALLLGTVKTILQHSTNTPSTGATKKI
jgi:transcriptional regulator with XRE-family HTH domain